jgi:hypothetical protein
VLVADLRPVSSLGLPVRLATVLGAVERNLRPADCRLIAPLADARTPTLGVYLGCPPSLRPERAAAQYLDAHQLAATRNIEPLELLAALPAALQSAPGAHDTPPADA